MTLADTALTSLTAAADHLGSVQFHFVALALLFQFANLALRSVAWRNVLVAAYPDREVPLFGVAASYAAGVALNAFLPARGGEAAKIALARTRVRDSSVGTIASSTSVVLLFDAVMGLTLIGVALGLGLMPAAPALPAPPAGAAVLLAHPVAIGALTLTAGTAAVAVWRRFDTRLRGLGRQLLQGVVILRTPGRYLREVVALQLGAWVCRIAVTFFLLAAFGLPATLPLAALVVVVSGVAGLVPVTPGGVGTYQALVVYALHETVSTASALSFSIGLQAGVTIANTLLGLTAMMLLFRTLRPAEAVRAGLRVARTTRR
jgi:uncharacterized membrane protein YbhN (UPF0104 family)